jgi:hypothetical protein
MKGASPPSHGKESWKQSSQNKKTDFFRHEGCEGRETLVSIRTSLKYKYLVLSIRVLEDLQLGHLGVPEL